MATVLISGIGWIQVAAPALIVEVIVVLILPLLRTRAGTHTIHIPAYWNSSRDHVDNHFFAVYQEPQQKASAPSGSPTNSRLNSWAPPASWGPLVASEAFHRPGPKPGNPIISLHRSLRTCGVGVVCFN